nr:hypothetical protein [Tanacetum cinerariifolium]
MKNDTVCKEKASNVFRKERKQYFEIQDLKAQLQDKNIAIYELKKLIKKCKGKSVETKFDKPSVVRQPNAQRIPKPSILGKPAPFSDSLERKYFPKTKPVPKTNKKDAQSHKTTKRYIPVEKKSDSKNHGRQIPIGQKFSPNKSSNMYLKTTPPRSSLTWKPTGRIFYQVGLKWIPIRKSVETYNNTNDSVSPSGKKTNNPNTTICANSSLSAGTSRTSKPISSKGSSNVNNLSTSSLYKHFIFNYVRKHF